MTAACSRCGGSGVEPEPSLFDDQPASAVVIMRDSFDEFWRLYPRKQSRATAAKKWTTMPPLERRRAIEALPTHVAMWQHEGRGTALIPHPTTWLNQRRWEDDLSGYTESSEPHKAMPGRSGIAAALANRANDQRAIGAGE